ncbi:glycosyltransferase family 4 protein [Sphingopyxis granuli]|uniref:glycosyltransferase family 4 protein n=1 Tax=Sphingopyxis granuli TaxID=267128 RepID=UPI001F533A18|nr:glycosyltransferase family 4 protein [Sphingopyxis granuli]UNK80920.1 glycosyltransferase family 4 protein [Sphingopyxis granuli]
MKFDPMRILAVSNFYDSHGGGLERVAAQLNREFVAAGCDVAWAASDSDGLPENPARLIGLRCVNPTEKLTGLPMPIPDPRSIAQLRKAIRNADAVVIHDALYVTSILAMIFAKTEKKPTVMIQHIGVIPFANSLLNFIMRLANLVVTRPMMDTADRLAFISATVRDDLLGKPPRRRSMLVFNGVDQSVFNDRQRFTRGETRAQWGLPLNATLAIFVGRFVEKKGLRVLRLLAKQRPDVQFALFGQGPIDPREWGLANVHPLGQQPQERIADLYRAADMLLLPSVGEGYPLVVQEAMACGLPVICGNDSAKADPTASRWLSGVNIDLADPQSSAARCSAAIDALVDLPIDTAAMARYAAKAYNWRQMASTLLNSLR